MKKSEIVIGGHYVAKVSGNLVTVRVDAIREVFLHHSFNSVSSAFRYDVTNLKTGRKVSFRSSQKFRSRVDTKLCGSDRAKTNNQRDAEYASGLHMERTV